MSGAEHAPGREARYAFGDCEVDVAARVLHRAGVRVAVQPKVFDLLVVLLERRSHVVSARELLDEVWTGVAVTPSALSRAIQKVRRAIGDDGDRQASIQTHRGHGFRFVAPVTIRRDKQETRAEGARDLVGREVEASRVSALLQKACAGPGAAVLLVGEAGIGKTRLAEEIAWEARRGGAIVHVPACAGGGGAPALWPWREILQSEFAARADELRSELGRDGVQVASVFSELRELFPAPVEAPPPLEAATQRFVAFTAVTRYLARLSTAQPLVLIFDDLHRCDPASLELLRLVGAQLGSMRALIVGTYRPPELERAPEQARLIAEFVARSNALVLSLPRFERAEVEAFARAFGTGPLEPASIEGLAERTGGNPFLLAQLLPLSEGPGDAAQAGLPLAVRAFVEECLEPLSDACRELLSVACVFASSFPVAALRYASEFEPEEFVGALEEAQRAHLLVTENLQSGEYAFALPVVRECLYGELAAVARARLHERVGLALVRLHGADAEEHADTFAFHFGEAAALGNERPAVDFEARAGRLAVEGRAYTAAVRHYERALALLERCAPGDDEARCGLLLRLAEALRDDDRLDAAREQFRRAAGIARRAELPRMLALAAIGELDDPEASRESGVEPNAARDLADALERLGGREPSLRARIQALLAVENEASAAEPATAEAWALALRARDPASQAAVLWARYQLLPSANLAERSELAERLGGLAHRAGDARLSFAHRQLRIALHFERGEMAGLEREIWEYESHARGLKRPESIGYAQLCGAALDLLRGEFARARATIEAVRASALEHGDPALERRCLAQLAYLDFELGRGSRRIAPGEPLERLSHANDALPHARAYALAEAGDLERARPLFDSLLAECEEQAASPIALGLLAEVCWLLRDVRAAQPLLERLKPFEDRYITATHADLCLGSAARPVAKLLAVAARWREARATFEYALEMDGRIGALPWQARTRFDYARALGLQGAPDDRARIAELLAAVLETTRRLGMHRLQHEALAFRRSLPGAARRSARRARSAGGVAGRHAAR